MAFNHYAKVANIYLQNPTCYIKVINQPTKTTRFDGGYNYYSHYYRLVDQDGHDIKYGKFQQLDKLAKILKVEIDDLRML